MIETVVAHDYAAMDTPALLDLLVKQEDRVTETHIRELAKRSDAVEKSTEWLTDEDRWFEAEFGEWWVLYHAFTILCLRGQPEEMGVVLQALKYAIKTSNDWIMDIAPTALARFGAAGIERMIQFGNDERPTQSLPLEKGFISLQDRLWERHGWKPQFNGGDSTHWRGRVCTGLTRIGLEHPAERARIAEFLCSCFNDPAELDGTFLGFVVLEVLVLDRQQALEPIRLAYERKAVDPTIAGKYEDAIGDKFHSEDYWEYKKDLLDFYSPDEIASRQKRWQEEEAEDNDDDQLDPLERVRILESLRNFERLTGYDAHHSAAPAGYKETQDGVFVRESTKVGRNDPCPCGSGKKYKKCCGA